MLQNDHRIIYKGTDSIAIVGVENSGKPPFPDRGDLPKALQGTDGMFKVLLSHDPTHCAGKCFRTPRYSLPCQVIPTTCKSVCSASQCPSLSIRNTETVSGGQPGTVCQHRVRLCALPHALRCLAGNYRSHIKKRK